MSARRILTVGASALRKYAKPVPREEINSKETRAIVRDMQMTLRERKGPALSAPQIGVQKQIIIFDIPHLDRQYDAWPHTVVYNPRVEHQFTDEQLWGWEECHSVPGLVGLVKRYKNCAMFWHVRLASSRTAQWRLNDLPCTF